MSRTITEEDVLSTVYNIYKYSYRGLAVIVQNFHPHNRGFSTVDSQCEELKDVLEQIENEPFDIFDKKICKCSSRENLFELCDKVTDQLQKNSDEYPCLLFVLLTRGRPGLFLCHGSREEYIQQSEILKRFQPQHCPSLALKPKLFIIQTMKEDPDPNQSDAMGIPDTVAREIRQYKIPRESDFLTYTSDQYFKLDDNVFLSSIIETLRNEITYWHTQSHKHERDVTEIQRVFIKINKTFKEKMKGRERTNIPCTMSSLTKKMFLQRKRLDL